MNNTTIKKELKQNFQSIYREAFEQVSLKRNSNPKLSQQLHIKSQKLPVLVKSYEDMVKNQKVSNDSKNSENQSFKMFERNKSVGSLARKKSVQNIALRTKFQNFYSRKNSLFDIDTLRQKVQTKTTNREKGVIPHSSRRQSEAVSGTLPMHKLELLAAVDNKKIIFRMRSSKTNFSQNTEAKTRKQRFKTQIQNLSRNIEENEWNSVRNRVKDIDFDQLDFIRFVKENK